MFDKDKQAVLEERAAMHESEYVTFSGLDDALVGTAGDSGVWRTVYSQDGIISILMERDGMSREDAFEYFSYNIEGLHCGDNSPLILEDI